MIDLYFHVKYRVNVGVSDPIATPYDLHSNHRLLVDMGIARLR